MSVRTGGRTSIKSSTASGLRNGVYTNIGVRPQGYQFPIGLSANITNTLTNTFVLSSGGSKTMSGTNAVHTFTVSGEFVPSFTGTVETLIVAGGGGGGNGQYFGRPGGGGGAGGYIYSSSSPVISGNTYTIAVGAGGSNGVSGDNSSFNGLVSVGGGYGAVGSSGTPQVGAPGGSGGGGQNNVGGTGVPGQGNAGGGRAVSPMVTSATGGGGGAGGAGGTEPNLGGGSGVTYSISGSPTIYAAGGGAGPGGAGGSPGVGGNGAVTDSTPATAGAVNRGGGGGGGTQSTTPGGPIGQPVTYFVRAGESGGSGVVYVRYISQTAYQNSSSYSIN